jgi:hypothetical protein
VTCSGILEQCSGIADTHESGILEQCSGIADTHDAVLDCYHARCVQRCPDHDFHSQSQNLEALAGRG